ncbi:hypothetical protein OIO90_001364 [Microbotryomycetes sp. JL221]|nr:hypothetical protein OIO90_001364 [Microbotryomycetes sp. JL221]
MADMCQAAADNSQLLQPVTSTVHYILSGTFNTIFLYLLAFNPSTSTLTISKTYRAQGPHQYLALNPQRTKAYATTWASEPSLSSWNIVDGGRGGIEHINTVPISCVSATSSYIQVSSRLPRIYSAGGPTGEVHAIDPETGGFGTKLQQLLYVDQNKLEQADKTRVALRYGSHGIDINLPRQQVFVPHLGHNSIFMYDIDQEDGTLKFVANCPSFDQHDGPRHNVPSPDGSKLYVITEHTSFVDVYEIQRSSLKHIQRLSVIPPSKYQDRLSYRGDTLRLSQSGSFLYVTTRGKTSQTQGFVSVWNVNKDGTLGSQDSMEQDEQENQTFAPIDRYQTLTSGGKANAIETFPFHRQSNHVTKFQVQTSHQSLRWQEEKDWILLTDDEQGWVWVLEFDGNKIREVAGVQLGVDGEPDEQGTGASHAVWLS